MGLGLGLGLELGLDNSIFRGIGIRQKIESGVVWQRQEEEQRREKWAKEEEKLTPRSRQQQHQSGQSLNPNKTFGFLASKTQISSL